LYGHLSILFGEARTMTVVVRSTTADVIVLPRVAFFRLGLDAAFIEDLEYRRDILRRTGAFVGFDEDTLLRLCCAAKYRSCPKGTVIIRQGDVPRELCVLTKGVVHAFKAADALADLAEKMRGIAEEMQ
jgi:CRP-like cAMP-binding protein